MTPAMLRAPLDDVTLEYELRGAGEPVLFIHGGLCATWFQDLLHRPELSGGRRLIRYHRIGYAGSDHVTGPVSIGRQAAHGHALLRHLGIASAHVVGHSSGANIALQLALDHPESVRSLALLETALLAVPTGPFAGQAIQHYRTGDHATAVDTWLGGVAGPDYRTALDRVLPGAFDQAVADAGTFFDQELPAVREWSFGPRDAKRIGQPVLTVLGARSDTVSPVFRQRHELLLTWLPDTQPFILPDATHLLQVDNPGGMAGRLARFIADTR
jgi:pimeloyl-ACP methyl ester carboxylesterase